MDPPQPPLLVPPPSMPPPFAAGTVPADVPAAETPLEAAPSPPQPPSSASPPQNHVVAHAASANPTQTPAFNHPPYAEMIYTAITALKERDGSSKRAIAKYIERVYSGLPPTHPALLTHHLKRLKSSGLLVMVKKSYMLPRSDTADATAADSATATANTDSSTAAYSQLDQQQLPSAHGSSPTPSASPAVGVKRGRGRPPKPKPGGFPHQAVAQPNGFPSQVNGVPLDGHANSAAPASASSDAAAVATQPNSVPVGFAPDPASMEVKRRPGRPRKVVEVGQSVPGAPVAVAAKQGRGRGRPLKNGLLGPKRSPGRPRKPKSIGAIKKRPGRPPKNPQLANPVAVPYATLPAGASSPADVAVPASVAVPTGAAVPVFNMPRPRGRPRKNPPGSVTALHAAGSGVVHARRPGRPPKLGGGVTPRKSSGRPVGRPRKNANVSWAISEVSQKQAEAYGDLKRQLELFQTRVKEAVGALKPHLAGAAISAVVAIQELEGIASMDINTPLSLEAQSHSEIEPPQPQLEIQTQTEPQTEPQPPPHPQLQLQLQPPIHQN